MPAGQNMQVNKLSNGATMQEPELETNYMSDVNRKNVLRFSNAI